MPDVSLRGFKDLDKSEILAVQKILVEKIKKLRIQQEFVIGLELKQHKHRYKNQTRIIHEIKIDIFLRKGKPIAAKAEDANLYKAIDKAMERLTKELKHKFKK